MCTRTKPGYISLMRRHLYNFSSQFQRFYCYLCFFLALFGLCERYLLANLVANSKIQDQTIYVCMHDVRM